jgi:hypothetical protein
MMKRKLGDAEASTGFIQLLIEEKVAQKQFAKKNRSHTRDLGIEQSMSR